MYNDKDMATATKFVQSINRLFLLLLVHNDRRLNNTVMFLNCASKIVPS